MRQICEANGRFRKLENFLPVSRPLGSVRYLSYWAPVSLRVRLTMIQAESRPTPAWAHSMVMGCSGRCHSCIRLWREFRRSVRASDVWADEELAAICRQFFLAGACSSLLECLSLPMSSIFEVISL